MELRQLGKGAVVPNKNKMFPQMEVAFFVSYILSIKEKKNHPDYLFSVCVGNSRFTAVFYCNFNSFVKINPIDASEKTKISISNHMSKSGNQSTCINNVV